MPPNSDIDPTVYDFTLDNFKYLLFYFSAGNKISAFVTRDCSKLHLSRLGSVVPARIYSTTAVIGVP